MSGSWATGARGGVVAGTGVGVTLLLLTSLYDVFSLPKVFALGVGAVVLVLVVVWTGVARGGVRVPKEPAALLAVGFVSILSVLSLIHGDLQRSSFGEPLRGAGLIAYGAGVLVLLVTVLDLDERTLPAVLRWLSVAFALVVAYGVLQALGFELLGAPSYDSVVLTLGQINFAGGFSGIIFPVLVWAAVTRNHTLPWRVGAGVAAVAALVVAAATESLQAFGAVGAGAVVVGTALALERWPARRVGLGVLAAVIAMSGVGLALSSRVEAELAEGLDERLLMWESAGELIRERPLQGWGVSGYAQEFGRVRPARHLAEFGLNHLVNEPHSVPLSILVSGGLLLGGLYLLFVAAVAVVLARGLLRTSGARRVLLGAVGGAWAAYQVQSLVSIDVPTLLFAHFFFAGAVLAVAGGGAVWRWEPAPLRPARRGMSRAELVLKGGAAVVAVATVWLLARPLVADNAFAAGRRARVAGDVQTAREQLTRAVDLAGWNPAYWPPLAALHVDLGDEDAALAAGMTAAERNPSAVAYSIAVAQLAQRTERDEMAIHYFDKAIRNAPRSQEPYQAKAQYLVAEGRERDAVALLRRARERVVRSVELRLMLAGLLAESDPDAAEAEYRAVLGVEPKNDHAIIGLAELER